MSLYRHFTTQAEIDAQYDVRRSVEDPAPYREFFAAKSAEARELPNVRLGVPFGPTAEEYLDVYPAGPGAPALVFIHGGFWRASSAREHGYVAHGPRARGITVIVTNYALCPDVDIAEITRQSHAAVAWIDRYADELEIDRTRIYAAGHSAGAQQVAMLLRRDPPGAHGLAGKVLRAAIGMSGIYDLSPLRHSFLQPVLELDDELIATQSPHLDLPSEAAPMLLTVGGDESEEFQRQSRDHAAACSRAGLDVELAVRLGENHYTIAAELADAESSLCRTLASWIDDETTPPRFTP